MASIQAKGEVKFYRRDQNGGTVSLFANNLAALAPNGSPNGDIASTPDQWTFIPLANSAKKFLRVNDQLVVSFTPSANVSVVANYGKVILPCTYQDGTPFTLGDFDNSTDWDVQVLGDTAFVAGVESIIAAKKVLSPFALGSMTQKCFVSIEDNTV